jgi:hypothetical protein
MMDKHLERALIETYFAIAEFDERKIAPDWRGGKEQTEALASVLRAARTALENSVRQAREIRVAGDSKA